LNLAQLLDQLKADDRFGRHVTRWEVMPPTAGRYAEFPEGLDPRLVDVLRKRGVDRLYTHQAESFALAEAGKSFVVPTPTASGKTLCYNLPVLNKILADPQARALYLFPTKALSQDQMHEVHETVSALGVDIKTFTFDGDTPETARRAIRSSGHIVVTNPDMLHQGILPHHTLWIKLFENLKFIVLDEIHAYRGVFGSHLANVIRRLKRLCRFYGSEPQFICSSATIANPKELAENILEEEVEADDIKFDVNHRFPIYYEEKRPFFLESADNFSTPLVTLFHSRNIIDPDLCFKFVRQWGNQTIASLYALERDQPGERFGFENTTGDINWYLFRYKYSLKGDSYLGLYSLNRKFEGSQNNVFSFDGRYKFTKRQAVSFMGLFSRYSDSPQFDKKTINGGGWDWKYDFTSRYFNYSFETYGVSDGFYDDAGFFRRNDYWFHSNLFNFHYEPESDKTTVRLASAYYEHTIAHDFHGNLTDRKDSLNFLLGLKGGHILVFAPSKSYELYLNNGYRYNHYLVNYWCNHFKKFHFGGYYQWGNGVYYDYYFPRKGNSYLIYLSMNIYPSSKVYISMGTYFSRMHNLADTQRLYGFFAEETEFKYQFTKNNYTRVMYQYTHYNYPLYSYSANNHFIQIVHTYNPRAYTALYFGFLYGRDHSLYHPRDWDYNRNYKLFVKLDYMFDVDF